MAKYTGAQILAETDLLALIEHEGNSFWVKKSDLEEPKPKPAAPRIRVKKVKSLGFGHGQHKRWHTSRGIISDRCKFCVAAVKESLTRA